MTREAADPDIPVGAYVLLILGSLGYALFMLLWFLLPAFLSPIIAELGISNTAAGVLTGAIPLMYIPIGLASGLIIDRIGSRRGIGLGLMLLGIGHAARAGATDFLTMLLPTLLMGVGGTGVTFGLPKLVSDLFPPERSGSMSSIYLIGSYLGTALAFSLGRPILGPYLGGWRGAFQATGLFVILFAVGWLFIGRFLLPRVKYVDADTDREDQTFSFASLRRDLSQVFSHRDLRLLVVIGTMYLLVLHGSQAWLATVLEVRGLGVVLAGTITSILVAGRFLGTISIPPLSDRLGLRRPMIMLCGGLATLGSVGLLVSGRMVWATILVVFVIGVGLGGVSPLMRALPIELDGIGPRLTATATGLIYAIGEIGGFLGPFLVGALQDATGTYTAGFSLLAGGGLVIIAAGAKMTEPGSEPAQA